MLLSSVFVTEFVLCVFHLCCCGLQSKHLSRVYARLLSRFSCFVEFLFLVRNTVLSQLGFASEFLNVTELLLSWVMSTELLLNLLIELAMVFL